MALIAYCDFDMPWIASDRENHVALFWTGGAGPVPTAALAAVPGTASYFDLCPDFNELPAICQAEKYHHASGKSYAERGLFVYDWADASRVKSKRSNVYEREAKPMQPVTVDELPAYFAQLALATKLAEVSFRKSTHVNVRKYFECCGD